jgi:hypothetical protein
MKRRVKRGKAKRGKRRGKTGYFKSKVGRGEVMINRVSARLHSVVAPHYLTRLQYAFQGTVNSSATVSPNQWAQYANALYFPGNTPSTFTGAGPSGLQTNVLFPATLAINALNPSGFTQLSVLYSRYRVFASKITITYTPTNLSIGGSGGNASLLIYPQTSDLPVLDFQRAMSLPYSKYIMCTENNNVKQNTLSVYMDNPTICGYTKQQYKDDPNTSALINAVPAFATYWNVMLQGFNAGDYPQGSIDLKVVYTVEFYDPLPPTDI